MSEVTGDERIGPALCARRMRMRFEFTDLGLALNVTTSDADQAVQWSFGDVDWEPKLILEMTSEVANRYLLGRESLAIAIARGRVRVRGESRIALLYVPATKLISEPYRRVVAAGFPVLAAA